jgi:beta-N-acetylhexosaminidase
MRKLTTHQKIGQRFMVGVDSTCLDDELKTAINTHLVGGIILFARNLKGPDQIADLCNGAQAHASQCGQPPLFISIDQEGGQVARLKPPFTQFPGHPPIGSMKEAIEFATITARELHQIGVNMDMAPVLDVLPPEGPSVMQKRAFGRDPQLVADMGAAVITHLQERGIMAVGKHFPGIGRTVLDSHDDLPDLDIDRAELESSDLVPFRKAVEVGAAGIMLSHIRYHALDAIWPASISPTIAGDFLRRHLGYNGLVLTDDLDMGAVAKHVEIPTIVDQCLKAEVDILLICHPGPKIIEAMEEAGRRIDASEDLQLKNEASINRIMQAKSTFLESGKGLDHG